MARTYPGITTKNVPNRGIRDILDEIDLKIRDLDRQVAAFNNITPTSLLAKKDESFVVMALSGDLDNERRLSASVPITLVDGGAGGSASLGFDITTLAADATPDGAADLVVTYDDSAGIHKKVLLDDLPGGGGGVTFAIPTIGYGTAFVEGVATTSIRSDATLKFPASLLDSIGGLLTLTQSGGDQSLTGNTGDLKIKPGATTDVLVLGDGSLDGADKGKVRIGSLVFSDAKFAVRTRVDASNNKAIAAAISQPLDSSTSQCISLLWETASGTQGQNSTCLAFRPDFRPRFTSGTPKDHASAIAVSTALRLNGADDASHTLNEYVGLDLNALNSFTGGVVVRSIGLRTIEQGAEVTTAWGFDVNNHCRIVSGTVIARNETLLALVQNDTGAVAGAHLNFNDKAGDPPSPVIGDLWRSGAALNYRKDGSTTIDLTSGGYVHPNHTSEVTSVGDGDQTIDKTIAPTWTGLHNFIANGAGDLTDYDLEVGDTTTPDYGILRIGDSCLGRTSHVALDGPPTYNLNGAFIFQNPSGPVTGDIEFGFLDSDGLLRFGLPKSAVGNATYSPRSMIIAGPAVADSDIVTVAHWQGEGIFDNLVCDTAGSGADCGIQNDLEVEGDIFTDSIKGSTDNTSISIVPHGTGNVILSAFVFDVDQTVGAGQDNFVLTYDNSTGLISLEVVPGAGGGTEVQVDTGGVLAAADFQDGGDINFAESIGVVTATVKAATVTFAKIQDIKENSVMGRDTLTTGVSQAMDETDLALISHASTAVGDTWLGWTNAGLLRKFDAVILPILETEGGTDITTYAQGDMLYSDATDSLAKLAKGNTTGAIQILEQGATIPVWTTVEDEHASTLENPDGAEDITMFYTSNKIEITEVRGVHVSMGASLVGVNIHHNSQRSQAGTTVLSSGLTISSSSVGNTGTLKTDGSEDIPAGSWVWWESASGGGGSGLVTINIKFRRIF